MTYLSLATLIAIGVATEVFRSTEDDYPVNKEMYEELRTKALTWTP
jgi:hypothetical protein